MATVFSKTASAPDPDPVSLAGRYRRVRDASRTLAAPLAAEDQVVQTIPEVSPTKWHLAHVTWFFEQFCLLRYVKGYRAYDEAYLHLFNSYYYTVGEMYQRSRRGLLSRPTVAEIQAYRTHVDAAMQRLIEDRGDDPGLAFLITLGLNHEQQHQELLLTDIKHVFFTNPIGPAYAPSPRQTNEQRGAPPLEFVARDGGIRQIGAAGSAFCFDNETPRHDVLLSPHTLGNRLVTNGEYRAFIDDGGYTEPALWLSDGWATIRGEGWSRPLCWAEDLEREFTLHGWQPIEADAPVCHVSFYEADAFARWAGARLPSEAEWELAAEQADADDREANLLDTGRLQPLAADVARGGEPLLQLYGDVWEWTASSYGPYPGFEPLAGSLGEYNGKFMCNQMVVRGGSCATWRDHIRATYRSFFYPRDRWQFLGFRLAKDG